MNDIEWTPAYWSNDLLGTRVKLTNGSNEIVGVLRTLNSGDHQVLVETGGIVSLGRPGAWHVFTETVPAVVLPTIPGWYFDKDGDPWQFEAGDDPLKGKWAPYTRIRTEAEVAVEVLTEWRRNYLTDDPTYWARLDALTARWAKK
ncbi:hypothetical protein E3T43_01120 [Cryobacterium sp. Hh7]|uniref:hypothetical protein n=1 Tax=Cryobacterium sp. Hh7 TaxID=1259159 RepID=UPI00106AE421|nr:hypothetical protein [Cryobacterium sp. Hh7]TFD61101.1 hypothetical protein E3T43_01120 [Cryobacterium sp. Hh7]